MHPAARFQVDVAALNATFAEALASPSEADDDDGELAHDDETELEDDADAGARTGGPGTDDPAATGIELDKVAGTPQTWRQIKRMTCRTAGRKVRLRYRRHPKNSSGRMLSL